MRLFVAVWPSVEVVSALRGLPRPPVEGLRWTTEDQWHVTLRFLGEADPEGVVEALRRLRPPAVPPVAALGDRVRDFGGRVVQVPVAGLDELAESVAAATASEGMPPPPGRSFQGHLTLGRVNRRGAEPSLAAVTGTTLPPLAWPVAEVTLVWSRLLRSGARYEVLDRTPVRNYTGGSTPG